MGYISCRGKINHTNINFRPTNLILLTLIAGILFIYIHIYIYFNCDHVWCRSCDMKLLCGKNEKHDIGKKAIYCNLLQYPWAYFFYHFINSIFKSCIPQCGMFSNNQCFAYLCFHVPIHMFQLR